MRFYFVLMAIFSVNLFGNETTFREIQNLLTKENPVFYSQDQNLKADEVLFAVEISKGSFYKNEFRTATGQLFLDRRICTRKVLGEKKQIREFPINYGVMVGRFNVDKDPLDLVVLGNENFYEKQIKDQNIVPKTVHILGIMQMEECDNTPCTKDSEWIQDWKILAVDLEDKKYSSITSLDKVPSAILSELKEYFANYKGVAEKGGVLSPLTRVVGFLNKEKALEFMKQTHFFNKEERAAELQFCSKEYKNILQKRLSLEKIKQPEVNEVFLNCLPRVFPLEYFKNESDFKFFIRYSAYQVLKGFLKEDLATIDNYESLMKKRKEDKSTYYRFAAIEPNAYGSETPIFEWIKTKARNEGCLDSAPEQHYEKMPIIQTSKVLF